MNNEQPAPGRRDFAPGAPGRRDLAHDRDHDHREPGALGHSGRDRVSDLVGSSEKVQVSRGYTALVIPVRRFSILNKQRCNARTFT